MPLISPEEVHAIPGQSGACIRGKQIEQAFRSGSAGERNCELAAFLYRVVCRAHDLSGRGVEQLLRSSEYANLN